MSIKLQQRLIGGSVFLISLIVYLLTLEPTASFWDCSEFITCAYKLEVGHAPGAPLFMLLGRFFSLFVGNNTELVAKAINTLSAVASALTVMLLYYIIYWFATRLNEKLISSNTEKANNTNSIHYLAIIAALVGSLTYAFSDSFWFSAVEAEVYATSSFFSALVFWCIIKYEQAPNGWSANRWLVLIFFLLGLSVGVHLLNLLALPAMALVAYNKYYKLTLKRAIIVVLLSSLFIVVFIYGIIPGIAKMAAYFDLTFANTFHLPVYSGALFSVLLLISCLLFLMYYFKKKKLFVRHFIVLLFSFWLIGYSSFIILVIRSNDNPFVDINNVENIFGLVDYLNREQYPSRPLVYGNNYNSQVVGSKTRQTYKLYNDKYFQDELNPKYEFNKQTLSVFPRMASMDARHVEAYQQWVDIKGRNVKIREQDGSSKEIKVPLFTDNLKFFVKYQVIHMYFRYFMWNFAGKQNDIQGYGGRYHGNWISGIPFIDNWRLGSQENIPDEYKQNKARNKYYLIPLLLGIIGFIFHLKHDKKKFWVALTLFLLTGPAIIIYLNEVPITPRERDYVHVGSFLVFTIWIGLGANAILHSLKKITSNKYLSWLGAAALLLLVPGLLISENWDDHNRSERYTARDFGKNMLSSCEQNAILFTTADNDTYPLWYLQQVEGYRTDIRQILTTFLPVGWYANQLNYTHEGSGSTPISFSDSELLMKKNQYFPVLNKIDSSIDVKQMVQFIKNNDDRTKVTIGNEKKISFIPSSELSLPINRTNVINNISYIQIDANKLPKKLDFAITKRYLTRDDLLILDILANNDWKRPVYFVYPSLVQELGLAEYLHQEGMLYRLLPYKRQNALHNKTEFALHQHELITKTFVWGNVNNPAVFLDHTNKQMIGSFRFLQMFADAANQLSTVGENNKAVELIDLALELFPSDRISHSYLSANLVKSYYKAGAVEKANTLANNIHSSAKNKLQYYLKDSSQSVNNLGSETQLQLYLMQELIQITENHNKQLHNEFIADFEAIYQRQVARN